MKSVYVNIWNATSGDLGPHASAHRDEESAVEEIVDGMLTMAYSETVVITYNDYPAAVAVLDLNRDAERESLERRREEQVELASACSWER